VGGVTRTIAGRPVVSGTAQGTALVTEVPLSFWGGLDPVTGEVIDRRHPLSGLNLAGRALSLPHGRGSCSASGVLLEAIRNGVAPAAILITRLDPIVGLGAILGEELYALTMPVVLIATDEALLIRTGDLLAIAENGTVVVTTDEAMNPDDPL
jgi:predicted aconitase with swiveling domain